MRISVYSGTSCEPPTDSTPARLPDLLKSDGVLVWVDITGPDEEDVRVLEEVFRFHPLAIEDTRNQRQRPKVEEYPGYVFTILNPVALVDGEIEFGEMDIFLGHNFVVTVHGQSEPVVDEARARVDDLCTIRTMSSGYLLYVLVDSVVDSYFPILDHIGDEIEQIEDEIMQKPREAHLGRLFAVKRMLSEMWRVAGQQRDMFGVLMRENHDLVKDDALRYYMRDVYDHVLRISDNVNTFRDTLSSVVDLYMSAVSNRLNVQVNRLTIITIGIGMLAVVTGFYGMNFESTWPPFTASWGVPFVVVLMLIVLGVVFAAVYRNRRQP